MLRSSAPSAPLERPSDSRRSGTREARVAKQKPFSAKTNATALRAVVADAPGWPEVTIGAVTGARRPVVRTRART